MIAGGLRGLLRNRGEQIEGVILPIYVPISLRLGRSSEEGGNLISQMVVSLPLGIADPQLRLRQIAAETARRKAIGRPSLGTMFHSRLLRGAMLKLIVRQRVNVVSADLPGPQTPLYFAGARLIEVFPLLNLVGNESLGVGALSYAGQFTSWRWATRMPIPTSMSSLRARATTYAYSSSPPPGPAARALHSESADQAPTKPRWCRTLRMASAAVPAARPPITHGRGLRKSGRLSKDITSSNRRMAAPCLGPPSNTTRRFIPNSGK